MSNFAGITVAFVLGALIAHYSGYSPLYAYKSLLQGSFGSLYSIAETLLNTTPLLIIALGLSVSFKAKLFNIGAPGQLTMGALAATLLWLALQGIPPVFFITFMIIVGFLGGAAYALISVILKIKYNVYEGFSTVLLNYIALQFMLFMVQGPIRTGEFGAGWTAIIPVLERLPKLLPGTRLHIGLLLAIALVPLILLLFKNTIIGYRIRAIGENRKAAHYSGINVNRYLMFSMAISGGFAGLAGVIELTGVVFRLKVGFPFAVGFTAIIVAWLGKNNPIGISIASFLFGALITGGKAMQRSAGVPLPLVFTLQSLILLTLLFSEFIFARLADKKK